MPLTQRGHEYRLEAFFTESPSLEESSLIHCHSHLYWEIKPNFFFFLWPVRTPIIVHASDFNLMHYNKFQGLTFVLGFGGFFFSLSCPMFWPVEGCTSGHSSVSLSDS